MTKIFWTNETIKLNPLNCPVLQVSGYLLNCQYSVDSMLLEALQNGPVIRVRKLIELFKLSPSLSFGAGGIFMPILCNQYGCTAHSNVNLTIHWQSVCSYT